MNDTAHLSIKNWAEEDRPREKLVQKGTQSLSDTELIAILIGSGNKNDSALSLAKKLLISQQNNLNTLAKLNHREIQKIKGLGEAKALIIVAALELGRRRKLSEIMERKKITNSSEAFEAFSSLTSDLPYEEFWVAYLNRANKIINIQKASQGGISGTVIDTRIILKQAIELLASTLILCHNHPSGNLMPSDADKSITQKITEAGKLMDIKVVDHIIVCDQKYFSFADEGLI